MVEDCAKLRSGAEMLTGQRGHATPAPGRLGKLAAPFMQLRHADIRHQMALVRLERRFKRGSFALIIVETPARICEIEPQRDRFRIGAGCGGKMLLGRRGFSAAKSFHPKDIVGDGMIGPKAKRCFSLAHDVRPLTLLLRLYRARQMLLDCHPHGR